MTRERWSQIAVVVALAALVGYGMWQRWQMLSASPFPLGVDGYYYPVQLRGLLEDGALPYPASPLTFWFMLPFAAATDPIVGAKLGAAVGGALVAIPAYGVGTQLGRGRGPGLVAAAVATTSASSAYLSMEFIKQGIGLTVALAAIWLVLRALAMPSRTRIALALAGVVAALLAHKVAAAVVLAIAVPAAIAEARRRGVLRGRRLLYILVAGVLLAIALVVAGLAAPERFLSPGDLALVQDLVTRTARWELPALARPGVVLTMGHEAAIGGVLAVVAAVVLVLRAPHRRRARRADDGPQHPPADDAARGRGDGLRRSERVVAWSFVALSLAIALPWLDVTNAQGLGFRMRLAAFVPLAMCAAIVAGAVARWLPARLGAWQREAVFAAVALVLVVRAPSDRQEGRVIPHPALVSAVLAATTKIPPGTTVIVPERHILFMVRWYTRAPAMLRPERVAYGQRVRLLPLHFIGMGSPLDEALDAARRDPAVTEPPLGVHPRHRNGLVLVAEPTWDWLLASLPLEVRQHWARWSTI